MDYGTVDVKCPFYKEETKNSICCEGDFGSSCIHIFKSRNYKNKHKEQFCNLFDFKKCSLYQSIFATYKKHPQETKGTFAEETLLTFQG